MDNPFKSRTDIHEIERATLKGFTIRRNAMGQITLQLPETLQKELESIAKAEGVALAQYIIYSLTRQVNSGYFVRPVPPEAIAQQRQQFNELLETWGEAASGQEIDGFLNAREIAEPEPELTPELIAKVQALIDAARKPVPA